ncbi:hypothetical protein G3I44_09560 [Halogeometricum borinquense]|uniref:Uncharacterized protein n=1 Tax=Halogeometricum borinquense TaxID=60847 RepID=A0A6C0UG79_9EURY|nr:hypothetical protein [Halogeometricum borinquense]QIB74504.1 hypothetical protein G3I44_09560 [Halogeometricum borinquense]
MVIKEETVIDAAGFVAGAVIGIFFALLGRAKAKSAVAVRPNLAEVGFEQAFMTRHIGNWLYYHYPDSTMAVTVVLTTLIIGVFLKGTH